MQRSPGFHKICTRLPGVPSQGGQITWFSQNLHQITWSPKSGGTRLPGPLLAIKWTRLPGKTRLPGGAKRGPEYLVSTKKGPDYLGAAPIGLTRAARVPGALYPRAVWPLLPPPTTTTTRLGLRAVSSLLSYSLAILSAYFLPVDPVFGSLCETVEKSVRALSGRTPAAARAQRARCEL